MKKFLKKIIKYGLLTLFIGNIIAFVCLFFFNKSSFYKPSYLINQFNTSTKIDYFIVGSSRGLTSINSKQIDKLLNVNGINLSMDDTGLLSHFLMIKHFFESGYESKNCILTLDKTNFNFTEKKLGNNDYRFISQTNKPYVREYYNKYDKSNLNKLKFSNFNPMFAYSYYNFELLFPSLLSIIKPNYRNRFDEYGNYSYPKSKKQFMLLESEEKKTFTTVTMDNPILEEINDYLKENNCKLIIYIAPYLDSYVEVGGTHFTVINNSNSIKEIDLFFDYIHVNTKGREKATSIFINSFKLFL